MHAYYTCTIKLIEKRPSKKFPSYTYIPSYPTCTNMQLEKQQSRISKKKWKIKIKIS